MEVVTSTQNNRPYFSELSKREFHLVTFAEDGASNFVSALVQGFKISRAEITKYCNQINHAEETGTFWPKAVVTAIPRKYCREALDDPRGLRYCIRDSFIANRDYWGFGKMLFDFTGNVLNAEELEDEILNFAMGEFNASPLEEVEIRFDSDPGGF